MLDFSIETFHIWFIICSFTYFLILFGYMHFSDKNDTLNNLLGFGALFFVFINILSFMLLMLQDDYLYNINIPTFFFALGLPILIVGSIILISTILVYLYRLFFKPKDYTEMKEKWHKRMKDMNKVRRDTYRKISHVLIFIGLFVIWWIGFDFVMNAEGKWAGMIPRNNNTLELYLTLLTTQDSITTILFSLGWFYYLIFFFFYAFTLFLLANEITRKTKYLAFPFNLIPKLVMTDEEIDSYGTYLYFAIGQLFASFLCPPMVYFSILGMSGIADLMTSQVGIRWGKHHIKWNLKKTWEGNIAGTITAFIICLPFIGIIWGFIFASVFMAIDLFTNKPFNISDNLLIPIGCALVYIFVRYFFDLDIIVFLHTLF
ncbi:MAG: hypothetical protein ACTSR8_22225 [Promethearchaeota archaeon]